MPRRGMWRKPRPRRRKTYEHTAGGRELRPAGCLVASPGVAQAVTDRRSRAGCAATRANLFIGHITTKGGAGRTRVPPGLLHWRHQAVEGFRDTGCTRPCPRGTNRSPKPFHSRGPGLVHLDSRGLRPEKEPRGLLGRKPLAGNQPCRLAESTRRGTPKGACGCPHGR